MSSTLKLEDVSSQYGAPMGRRSVLPDDPEAPISLKLDRLKLVDGDYDEGGAYWGGGSGTSIYCAWGEDSEHRVRIYVRAKNSDEAQKLVLEEVPGATFVLSFYDLCDAFTKAYIEAMLWSSIDDKDDPLDKNYSVDDLSRDLLEQAVKDCNKFQLKFADSIRAHEDISKTGKYHNIEMAGHDFWLTRVGSGAGFKDGDWNEPLASEMDALACRFGDVHVYVGDNGKLYLE